VIVDSGLLFLATLYKRLH